MKNIRNYGLVTGRLAKGLTVQGNKDGSRKILFTVAAQDNYVDKEGNRGTQFIQLEAFIPANRENNGVYEHLDCGDLISVSYSVRNNNYKNKDGVMVYNLVLLADEIALLESKASKEARLAAKAAS
ncbi:single-stranded DNA-binding protein [bacterium]|nr:single-stranded DNA-binding protein [bacterium]